MTSALAVFRKETIELLRDRRALMVLFSLPIVVMPLLMYAFTSVAFRLAQDRAESTVRVTADEETKAAYWELARIAFGATSIHRFRSVAESRNPLGLFGVGATIPEPTREQLEAFVDEVREQQRLTGGNRIDSTLLPDGVDPNALWVQELNEVILRPLALLRFQTMDADWDVEKIRQRVESREVEIGLRIRKESSRILNRDRPVYTIEVVYNASLLGSADAADRVTRLVERAGSVLKENNLGDLRIDRRFFEPVRVETTNLATDREMTLRLLGGIIPYIMLIFAFMGAFYPAIDLGAGEKERNTLEALLLTPTSRWELVAGKVATAFAFSFSSSALALTTFSISLVALLPVGLRGGILDGVTLVTVLQMLVLLIPICLILASGFVAISIQARSFKEAQNILSPLGILVTIPALVGLLPGIENSLMLALIPFLNLSLSMNDLLLGEIVIERLIAAVAINGSLSFIMMAYAVWQFHRESVLFRS